MPEACQAAGQPAPRLPQPPRQDHRRLNRVWDLRPATRRHPDDPTVLDHITPRAYGGGDDVANLQATHKRCNARKSAKLPGRY